jgi:hypothetical protein
MVRPWLALVAGALAIMVAGCATTVSGSPRARLDSRTESQPTSTAPVPGAEALTGLGDRTTLDPCSLTDLSVFKPFGTASFGEPDSLDDCLVEIKTSASEPVRLYVGSLDWAEALPGINTKPSTAIYAGNKIVYYDTGANYCNQLLALSDGVTLSVNAAQYDGAEPKLCDMVTAGMNQVIHVYAFGPVKHRHLASNSLGRLDPCLLVPADALTKVPGIGSIGAKGFPGKHGCVWTGPDGTRLRVIFTVGPPPRPAADGSAEVTIAGRASVRSPTPDAGNYVFCGLEVPHIPFAAPDHPGLVEIAAVFVRMAKGRLDPACTAATDVANAVWPRLPTP